MTHTPPSRPLCRGLSVWPAIAAACLLTACGGGNGSSSSATAAAAATDGRAQALAASKTDADGASVRLMPADRPASTHEARRFLALATFGPEVNDAELLMRLGYRAWIDRQLRLPARSHRAWWEAANAAIAAGTPGATAGLDQILESFWNQAATGPDQLRQRTAYALSQIFVISTLDSSVADQPRAVSAWLDMLNTEGLTTYRQLLESVARHPIMGRYLSHLRNQKASTATGRVPDENFAREVMQLFSIGLVRLNADGSPLLVNGQPVETYTPADISGLARVFTGWSFACPGFPSNNCFNNGSTGGTNSTSDPDREFKPMLGYPQYHSAEAKSFLGVTIPAQSPANPTASLAVALDTLANHPNVGPFIGRQLIQRLVTSNPSPAYISAISAVWADNGAGVRGDLKAVVRAILTHPEAKAVGNSAGKLREPVLRLSAYLRAFPHTSDTGSWKVGNTDNASSSLGQTPLRAPSVFNFYRPGYVAPGTQSAAAGMVGPEFQLLNESSVSAWVNFMRDNLSSGVGIYNGTVNGVVFNRRDLQRDWSTEMELAAQPGSYLADWVADRLMYSQPSAALRTEVANAVNSITVPALNSSGSNLAQVNAAKRNRINTAVLLTVAAPEFLVQK